MKKIDFTFGDAAVCAQDVCRKHNFFSSVATCRNLLSALNKFGKENIIPLSVKVLVFNPYVTKEFKTDNLSKKRLNALLNHKKGHSVILKDHLVLIANNEEGNWLIDPTLTIANSPEYNISLLPIGIKVDENFGKLDGSQAIFRLRDCLIIYSAFPFGTDYKEIFDFVNVDYVSNQIFERLANGE